MRKYVCVALTCALMIAATVLLAPTLARQQNTAVWTAELLPKSDAPEPEIESDLLVEGGQTVLLSEEEPYEIELRLWAPDFEIGALEITEENCKAAVTKSADDKDKYIFSIEKTEDSEDSEDILHSATLTWNYKDKKLSATFEYMSEQSFDPDSGDKKAKLDDLSTQYNESVPISFTVSGAPVVLSMKNGEAFPPKIRYTAGDRTVVLYDGGKINLEEGVTCSLDFSMTDVRQNVTLTAGDQEAEIVYLPFPVLNPIGDGKPLFMDGESLELPVSFLWGDTQPVVKIYQLIPTEGGVGWQEYDKITVQPTEGGMLRLLSNASPSGTYKIVINWQNSYSIETNFYIRAMGIREEVRN